jgi:hypothetical protein
MLFSRTTRVTLPSAFFACTAVLSGCPDPDDEFDAFGDRYNEINQTTSTSTGTGAGGAGSCTLPAAGAADGDFLFALTAKTFPTKPIAFLATLTTTAMGNDLSVSMRIQPLAAADRKTPAGTPLEAGPYPVAADGSFVAALPQFSAPGEANPISGSELEAAASLTGTLCEPADFICGTVDGGLSKPIMLSLKDSTFAMVRITDPNSYPELVTNCAKTEVPLP